MARAGVSALFHSVVRGGAHEAAHVAPHLASEAAHVAPRLGEDATHAATSGLHVTQDVLHDTATSAARDVTAAARSCALLVVKVCMKQPTWRLRVQKLLVNGNQNLL